MTYTATTNDNNMAGVNAGDLNSLGFEGSPHETRVVVAMSGGVDSSVVAALLAEEGYDVIGITLQLYDHGDAVKTKGACCAGSDIHDARMVAAKLGIKHYVLDYESKFKDQVMDDFADSYLKGETPIPCVRCNQTVKFTDLLKTARDLGAKCLATGHYVRRSDNGDAIQLKRGVDPNKDQSYFLFATTLDQLDYLRFPLGGMDKAETRDHAKRFGLMIADKPDSQDICFVPNGRYGDVVRKLRPGAVEPGQIIHHDGTVLGSHDGVIDYTIGQRRGLGIGGRKGNDDEGDKDNAPLYVVGINPANHQVIVGPKDLLECPIVQINDVNWLSDKRPSENYPVLARLRNMAPALPARITAWPDGVNGVAEITLDTPQYGIAAGQAAAIYDKDNPEILLGGGWITAAPTKALIDAGLTKN